METIWAAIAVAWSALGVVLLAIICAIALVSIIFGLPGTVIIAVSGFVYASVGQFERVSLFTALAVAGLALCAEGLELLLGARVANGGRPSARVTLAIIVGGFVGGLIGTPFLIGLGSLLGAIAGAFTGATLATASQGEGLSTSLATGTAAAKGRFLGFLAKGFVALLMTITLLVAASA